MRGIYLQNTHWSNSIYSYYRRYLVFRTARLERLERFVRLERVLVRPPFCGNPNFPSLYWGGGGRAGSNPLRGRGAEGPLVGPLRAREAEGPLAGPLRKGELKVRLLLSELRAREAEGPLAAPDAAKGVMHPGWHHDVAGGGGIPDIYLE